MVPCCTTGEFVHAKGALWHFHYQILISMQYLQRVADARKAHDMADWQSIAGHTAPIDFAPFIAPTVLGADKSFAVSMCSHLRTQL